MAKKIGILGWILSFLTALVLVSVGIATWTTFDLIATIFRIDLLIKIVYTIAALSGLIALIMLITKVLKR